MRRLQSRDGRREFGAFIAEGPQSVREAVAVSGLVRTLYVSPAGRVAYPELVASAQAHGADIVDATDEVIEAMAETRAPQGLVAECALPDSRLAEAVLADRVSVYLEGIADPGNVGTIIRTADGVGASGVAAGPSTADPFNGKSVRSTAGSIFHLPVAIDVELDELRGRANELGLVLAVASGDGEVELGEWARTAAAGVCWIFGNEAHGVSDQAKAIADVRVRIPMLGRAESLNVATAAGICLFADQICRHGRMGQS